MHRIAVFVDAGYFYASASELLFGAALRRSELRLANAEFVQYLARCAEAIGGCPLLRIYWYDGTDSGPTASHLALAYLYDVKLRLGFVNQAGEQKGGGLIFSDLTNLARNQAISDAMLVAGDEDLRVAVLQAQEHGIRMQLLGIAVRDAASNQSAALQREADTRRQLDAATITQFLVRRETAIPATGADDATEREHVGAGKDGSGGSASTGSRAGPAHDPCAVRPSRHGRNLPRRLRRRGTSSAFLRKGMITEGTSARCIGRLQWTDSRPSNLVNASAEPASNFGIMRGLGSLRRDDRRAMDGSGTNKIRVRGGP